MKANFDPLFNPKSIAVIGASGNNGKLGFHIMSSLIDGGFPGRVAPVNPKGGEIMGQAVFPSLSEVQGDVDLAMIVLPASLVPAQIQACAAKGVRGVILITAGFKEIDDSSGADLEAEVVRLANEADIPIIGPNTVGLVNPHLPLNASFTPSLSQIKKGGVAIISQSGGLASLVALLAMKANIGLSKIVGLGNRCNVDFADLLEWIVKDPQTKAIALYMEGIDDPQRFLSEIKRLNPQKPMIIYKTGRSEVADMACRSHTGSLAGRHEFYKAGFRQAGLLSVQNSEDLLDGARALAACPPPQGPRVAILSAQAGLAITSCDACAVNGLEIGSFSPQTQEKINSLLPPLALRTNPVDMGPGWYDLAAMKEILRAVMADERVDGILLFMLSSEANVAAINELSGLIIEWGQKKPLLTCFSSPPGIWDDEVRRLEEAGAIVNYPTPERAARALALLNKRRLVLERT